MTWAAKRQMQYILGILAVIGVFILIIIWPIITQKPTCSDGKKNGGEKGIDCGGICQRVCTEDVSEPVILWKRAFPVTGNIYNLVALIENRNKSVAINKISYEFRIYDTNNILIGRRTGTTFIPPNQQFAVLEPRFDSGQSKIKSVVFEFTPPFVWLKKEPTINNLPIKVENIILGDDKISPTLTAVVNNESVYELPEFDVVAILYDINGNAINVSKTHKDSLPSNQKTPVLFTWPNPLPTDVATKDILVQINPFSASF